MKSPTVRGKTIKINRLWAIIIGTGLALSPIHNSGLTNSVTQNGVVEVFIPAVGWALWLIGSLGFVVKYWEQLDWGNWKLLTAFAVIIASMGISGAIYGEGLKEKLAPLFTGLSFLAVYLVARKLGKDVFFILVPFVILGAVVSAINGLLYPGQPAGGLITNYCASAGFLIFGAMVNQGRWQWVLLAIMLIGLFFIGSLEAVFILVVLGIVVIARRDFSRRFIVVAGAMVLLVGIWVALGYLTPLYEGNHNLGVLFSLISGRMALTSDTLSALTTGRSVAIIEAMRNIGIFGHGYFLGTVGGGIVHNVPLIIVHQIGILAAIAWVFVTLYCLIKTKWKYAWVAILAMCVWDHYIWTQFAPYWWALAGASTTSVITSDKIFSRGGGQSLTSVLGKVASVFLGTYMGNRRIFSVMLAVGKLPFVLPILHCIWQTFGLKKAQLIDVQGFRMYTDPKEPLMSLCLQGNGCWEPAETAIFRGLVKPGMTVVDIGANIGYYSLLALSLVGASGKVYAFEPSVDIYETLKRNIEVNEGKNVTPICKAVTDKAGFINFYLSPSPSNNSISGKGKYISVPCTTLDNELAGVKVDVIKMDIEGAEALALAGMHSVIKNNPNLVLLTEVYPLGLEATGSSLELYVTELLQWFEVNLIDEKKHQLIPCESLEKVQEIMLKKSLLVLVCKGGNRA